MFEDSYLSSYKKYQAAALVSIQDFSDRLSFAYSTAILCFCTLVVSTKTYILKPLACHIPTKPGGAKFPAYLESYCWVQGTIPFRLNESIPQDEASWNAIAAERQINYYQWVPFILGLQTIMFYLPHVAWQNITFNRLGTDLTSIITKAISALKTTSPVEREKQIRNVAQRLELLLFSHRDDRQGAWAELKRHLHSIFGFLFVSKRMGTWTVFSYLCIKILYITNSIGQLYLMKNFLGYDKSMLGFGIHLTDSLIKGSDWRESLYFPRIAFCSVNVRQLGSADNRFLGMCALSVNMLNEKLYIFLWFWTLFVFLCSFTSLFVWIVRLTRKRMQVAVIRKYLKLSGISSELKSWYGDYLDPNDPKIVTRFIKEFLRLDGVFIVNMLYLNSGDVITGEVVRLLWKAWLDKYVDKHDFNCDLWMQYSQPIHLADVINEVEAGNEPTK